MIQFKDILIFLDLGYREALLKIFFLVVLRIIFSKIR